MLMYKRKEIIFIMKKNNFFFNSMCYFSWFNWMFKRQQNCR